MTQAIPKSIALIDYSHMTTAAFKAIAADSKRTPVQVAADTRETVIRQMNAIRSATEHVIVCLDSPPYWRKKIYPEYKGKRAEREPEFGAILDDTLGRVSADGYNIARAPEHEADDVIATLALIYASEYGCTDVRIVGADKDALQCVSDSVRLFVPKGRDEFDIRGPDWLLKEFAVKPEDFALLLAIMGDASDNIPGIKGLGKGHGAKLIELYKSPAGMAVGLTAAVNDAKLNDKKLSAVWERYAAGMAELPKWWKLTTLVSDAPLDKHPLKYLEKLPVQKLVEEPISDADDSDYDVVEDNPDWDAIAAETAERERSELAKALPVEPAKPAPRIGKDPNADKVLEEAYSTRLAAMNTNAPKTPERVAETQARIEAGNAAERTRPKGHTASSQTEEGSRAATGADLDRHGVERPKLPTAESVHAAHPTVPLESAKALVELGEQLGKEGLQATAQSLVDSARANGAAEPTRQAAAAASQVVPPTRGPRKPDVLEEPPMQAITPYAAPSWALSTQPSSAGHAFAIAVKLHNSRRYMGKHDTPEQIAAVILRGRELGIGMMTALDAFHVIQSKPCASAQLISALAERDPDHDYTMLVELDEKHAVVEIKHKRQPKPVRWSYTIEEAEALGLTLPSRKTGELSQWVKRPKTMLAKTAQVIGHRFMFPGATLGMHALETEPEAQDLVGNDD